MLTQSHPNYARVDDLLGALNGPTSVPNGTLKTVFTLIDELRDSGAPQDVIRIVESLSAAVHKSEWALRLRDGERQADVQDHIGALEKLCRADQNQATGEIVDPDTGEIIPA